MKDFKKWLADKLAPFFSKHGYKSWTFLFLALWLYGPVAGATSGSLTKSASDSNSANWSDGSVTVLLKYGVTVSDASWVIADAIDSVTGEITNPADSNTWTDAIAKANGVFLSPSDTGSANWVDSGGYYPQAASDDFNRTNSTGLGANWTRFLFTGSTLNVVSNQVQDSSTSAGAFYFYNGITWAADQYCQCDVINLASGASFGLVLRDLNDGAFGSNSVYLCGVTGPLGASATLYIQRIVNSSAVNIATTTATVNTGDTIRCAAVGSCLTVYINGSAKLSIIDSNIATGKAGVAINGPTATAPVVTLDNWSGGKQVFALAGIPIAASDDESGNWADAAGLAQQQRFALLDDQGGNWADIQTPLEGGRTNLNDDQSSNFSETEQGFQAGRLDLSEDQSLNWNETGTLLQDQVRSTSDAQLLADSPALLLGEQALSSNLITCGEFPDYEEKGGQFLFDTNDGNWADSGAQFEAEQLSVSELNSWSDVLSLVQLEGSALTDSISLTDTKTLLQGALLAKAETISVADSPSGQQFISLGLSDAFSPTDGSAYITASDDQLVPNDTNENNWSDAPATVGRGALNKTDDQSGSWDDNIVALQLGQKTFSDALSLADAAIRVLGVPLSPSDSLTLNESRTGIEFGATAFTDLIAWDDAASIVLFGSASPADTFTWTDGTARLRSNIVELEDDQTFNWLELLNYSKFGNVAFSDSLSVADSAGITLSRRTSVLDVFSWSDIAQWAAGISKAVADSQSSGFQSNAFQSDAFVQNNWVDLELKTLGVGAPIVAAPQDTNAGNWADAASSVVLTVPGITESVADTASGNWGDAQAINVAADTGQLTRSITDSTSSNWSDGTITVRFNYGVSITDWTSWAEATAKTVANPTGIVVFPVDTFSVTDSVAPLKTLAAQVSDTQAGNWSDETRWTASDKIHKFPADVNSWNDALGNREALIFQVSDSAVWADTSAFNYGLVARPADAVSLSDAVQTSGGSRYAVADTEASNWADTESPLLAATRSAAETLGLTDSSLTAIGKALGNAESNAVNWSDDSAQSETETTSSVDSLSFSDSIVRSLAETVQASDALALSDTTAQFQAISAIPSDTLTWTDNEAQVVGRVRTITDQVVPGDAVGLIFGFQPRPAELLAISDTPSSAETIAASTTDSTVPNWTDALLTVVFSGSPAAQESTANNWSDALGFFLTKTSVQGDSISATESGAIALGKALSVNDGLSLSDSGVVKAGIVSAAIIAKVWTTLSNQFSSVLSATPRLPSANASSVSVHETGSDSFT